MKVTKVHRARDVALRRPTSSQRQIRRPPAQDSGFNDQDLAGTLNYLIETRDFDNVAAPKLVFLHERLPGYIQTCVTDREFNRAQEHEKLRQDLQIELQREAELLNARRLSNRPDLTVPRFSQPSPQYI
jgi:hypothetical protein